MSLATLGATSRGGIAHADESGAYDARGTGADLAGGDDRRSRGTWAALLVGYIALAALTTGGAYALRDNVFGRSIAVSAAGWGGLGIGAGVGHGLYQLRHSNCVSGECTEDRDIAAAFGGFLGGLAATIAAHLLTSEAGLSRPYTAAAGMAPALIFLSVGTITDW